MVGSARGVGAAAVVAVWAVVATEFVFAWWAWFFLATTGDGPGVVLTAVMDGVNAVAWAVRPVAAVLVLRWLWLARSDAPGRHRYGQRWALWGWLPVVGWWVPHRVVADVWTASASDRGRSRAAVHWWWAWWLLYDLGGHAHFVLTLLTVGDLGKLRAPVRAVDLGELETVVRAGVVLPVFAAGAAVFLTIVVRGIPDRRSAPRAVTVVEPEGAA
ncbi:DUF4328 domain-containing protein [Actinosynnema sp. CS-041913]|uniref:DUF4328 domain-containing protein n=1 Tax=Actinosynnema sp. CS-041913 TaxID=3239917 RepID=UPI003D91F0F2